MKKENKILILILVLGLSLRLIDINEHYVGHHNWKESESGLIARYFYENHNYNIFYPHFDDVPTEEPNYAFQIGPWLAALLYNVFGVKEWVGRSISIIFSIGCIYLTYLISKKWFNERIALLSSYLMAIMPAQAFFGRNFQPESISLFFAMLSIYFLIKNYDKNKRKAILLSSTSLMIGALAKIVMLTTLLPIFVFILIKEKKVIKTIFPVFLISVISITPALSYMIWKYDTATKYNPEWRKYLLMPSFYFEHVKRAGSEILGPAIALLFLLSLLDLKLRKEKDLILISWVIAYILIIFITGRGALANSYYLFPVCAPISILVSKTLNKFLFSHKENKYISLLFLMIITLFTLKFTIYLFMMKDMALYEGGIAINRITEPNDLWIFSQIEKGRDFFVPTVVYYADREALYWHHNNEEELREFLNNSQVKAVLLLRDYSYIKPELMILIMNEYQLINETKDFLVFKK